MSIAKAFASSRLRRVEFEKFKADLELLLTVFTSQMLARWMGKDKGNFSKRVNGVRPVTAEFLGDFYRNLEPVIARVRQGATRYQIEKEMDVRPKEEADSLIRIRVEIFELRGGMSQVRVILDEHDVAIRKHDTTINEQDVAIKQLQEAVFGPKGPRERQPA